MRKNEYEKKIALKLKQIREAHRLSTVQMADKLRIYLKTYLRNENCTTTPGVPTLYNLGNGFNISLDWLLLDKGEMYYKEKPGEKKTETDIADNRPLSADMKELLDHMEKIPLLRFEMMSHFYKFKEEHPGLVEKAIKPSPAVENSEVNP